MFKLKIVYHERFKEVYAADPAATAGRMESIVRELQDFQFVVPAPAAEGDLLLVHSQDLVNRVKGTGLVYEIAVLAVGGAMQAADLAVRGESAFALIRPPGHHASSNSCWGFCWFNNVAVAVEGLRRAGKIEKALIIDIDLHYGDGTRNVFAGIPQVVYHHLESISDLERVLGHVGDCDLVAVSAGFDGHIDDWGGVFTTGDYHVLGTMIGGYARAACDGKVFGVLEGGYNHEVLGKNVRAFVTGLQKTGK